MALLQHLERKQELLAEHVLAPPVIGLRRQHRDRILGQLIAAKGGLAAPDREQHIARDAELLLDGAQRRVVIGRELLALLGEPRDRRLAHVIGRRLHELGLRRRRRLAARNLKIRQRQVRLDLMR